MEDKRKYSTDELVRLLEEFGPKPVPLFHMEIEAIIGRLRKADSDKAKADKLCEDARRVKEER